MNFKVIEVETKMTPNGKELKELTLKGEGQNHLEPRTTMWSDHPDFNKATVGATVMGTLDKKDSGTPIPNHPGKNYVNRTLLAGTAGEGGATGNPALEATVLSLVAWATTQGYGGDTNVEYPEGSNETPF